MARNKSSSPWAHSLKHKDIPALPDVFFWYSWQTKFCCCFLVLRFFLFVCLNMPNTRQKTGFYCCPDAAGFARWPEPCTPAFLIMHRYSLTMALHRSSPKPGTSWSYTAPSPISCCRTESLTIWIKHNYHNRNPGHICCTTLDNIIMEHIYFKNFSMHILTFCLIFSSDGLLKISIGWVQWVYLYLQDPWRRLNFLFKISSLLSFLSF